MFCQKLNVPVQPLLIGLAVMAGCSETASDNSNEQPPAVSEAEEATSETPIANDESKTFETDEGFQPLGLSDFEIYHGKEPVEEPTWTSQGAVIRCSGIPRGYLRSKKTYQDFTLKLEYRFPEPVEDASSFKGNSGFLIYITGDDKLWPKCLEVQGKFPEMATIKSNSRDVQIEVDDNEEARTQARKPPGEWNKIEIISKEGALTSKLNGELICTSQPSELIEGALGIQSEDFPVEYRHIQIRED